MKEREKLNTKGWIYSLLLLAGLGLAQPGWAASWSSYSQVQQIFIVNGAYFVQLNPSLVTDSEGCTNFDGWYLFSNNPSSNGTNNHDKIYAIILTAKALGKTISIHSSGCDFYPRADGAVIQ